MTNEEKLKRMSTYELAVWIADNIRHHGSMWDRWFRDKYCTDCPCEIVPGIDGTGTRAVKWCEARHQCRVFFGRMPNEVGIIEMWLDSREENADDEL